MNDKFDALVYPENILNLWKTSGGCMQVQSLYSTEGSRAYNLVTQNDYSEVLELTNVISKTSGDILELASGSGRLTLPLATLGRHITALDLSSEMLAILEDRIAHTPPSIGKNIEIIQGDMTDFHFPKKFGAILIAATSITLLDSFARQKLYKCALNHLAEDGFLIITISLDQEIKESCVLETHLQPTAEDKMVFVVNYDPKNSFRDVFLVHQKLGNNSMFDVFYSRVQLFTLSDLTCELAQAGFEIVTSEPVNSGSSKPTTAVVSARHIAHCKTQIGQ